jgi:Fe-S oxidoreductase
MVPSHQNLLSYLVFLAVTATGLAVFAGLIWRRWQILKLGKAEDRFHDIPARLGRLFKVGVFQAKILQERQAGLMHVLIFWGFCVVAINTATFVGEGFKLGFHFPFFGSGELLGKLYALSKDVFEGGVIIGLAIAFYRRLVLKPDRLTYSLEAHLILIFILVLMLTDFLMFGIKLNTGELRPEFARWVPISAGFGGLVSSWSESAQQFLFVVSFWLHLVVLFAFLNLLPISKHFHVITALPNVFFTSLLPKGTLTKTDFEDEKATSFGLGVVQDLTWKNIFDTYTCTECGRCEVVCPAWATRKPLSDKEINQDIKHFLFEGTRGGKKPPSDRPITGDVIADETIWACTTCRWCDDACPVNIENVPRIVEMRRYFVLTESKFPRELNAVFKGLENQSNPWGIGSNKRQEWADDVENPRWVSESPDFEYLFWVGCAGSYDDRNKKVAKAMIRILEAAGVSYAMLGDEEGCCGDSARRLGNEYLFQSLAQANVEIFAKHGVKKILVTCPHGYNTFKNEYPQFGGNYEVVHHTELVLRLLAEGRIRLQKPLDVTCTYHDSCFLGRYNKIFEPPRDILSAVPELRLREMPQNRLWSFCCGAGGGRMWLEEDIGERINRKRTDEALALNPDYVATACPFCLIMLDDGLKDKGAEERVKALDIAEIVVRSMA